MLTKFICKYGLSLTFHRTSEIVVKRNGFFNQQTYIVRIGFDNNIWEITRTPLETTFTKGGAHIARHRKTNNVYEPVNSAVCVWDSSRGKHVLVERKGQHSFYRFPLVPHPPALDEVLSCLQLDAMSIVDCQTWQEFADCFGYDTDSIENREVYFACQNIYENLKRFFGAAFGEFMELRIDE